MLALKSNALQRARNREIVDKIAEANKTENIGRSPDKEARLLAGVIAEIGRKNAWQDPRKQREIIAKVKRYQKFR